VHLGIRGLPGDDAPPDTLQRNLKAGSAFGRTAPAGHQSASATSLPQYSGASGPSGRPRGQQTKGSEWQTKGSESLIAKGLAPAITPLPKGQYPAFERLLNLLAESVVADHGAAVGARTDLFQLSGA